ncbi:9312_t:CDS:1 [Funneliformis geosporum]|nr:9312_t:CDS:1 [Funneliformis geosporum]
MANIMPNKHVWTPRRVKITLDSMIIKQEHAFVLANWVQRKDSNARIPKDIKFNFNLIYRGSRDGYETNNIRRKCYEQGAVIIIIKTKEDGTIIGGYNSLGLRYLMTTNQGFSTNYYWSNTTESFIFSLGDGDDLKNIKISRVVNSDCAIYSCNDKNIKLNFGNSDLIINKNSGSCNRRYYESEFIDADRFTIEEMEIFKFYKS